MNNRIGSRSAVPLTALAVVVGAAAGFPFWGKHPAVARSSGADAGPPAVEESSTGVVTTSGSAAVVPDAPASETTVIRFPGGQTAKALNDCKSSATCVWGDRPWSPIERVEFNNGLYWYVHRDGTYTTTTMTWRSDLGREDVVALCMHPTRRKTGAPR
jgi:hypothetical protein